MNTPYISLAPLSIVEYKVLCLYVEKYDFVKNSNSFLCFREKQRREDLSRMATDELQANMAIQEKEREEKTKRFIERQKAIEQRIAEIETREAANNLKVCNN